MASGFVEHLQRPSGFEIDGSLTLELQPIKSQVIYQGGACLNTSIGVSFVRSVPAMFVLVISAPTLLAASFLFGSWEPGRNPDDMMYVSWLPGLCASVALGTWLVFVVLHRVHKALFLKILKTFDVRIVALCTLFAWYISSGDGIQLAGDLRNWPEYILSFVLHVYYCCTLAAIDAMRMRPIIKKILLMALFIWSLFRVVGTAMLDKDWSGWNPDAKPLPFFGFWFLEQEPRELFLDAWLTNCLFLFRAIWHVSVKDEDFAYLSVPLMVSADGGQASRPRKSSKWSVDGLRVSRPRKSSKWSTSQPKDSLCTPRLPTPCAVSPTSWQEQHGGFLDHAGMEDPLDDADEPLDDPVPGGAPQLPPSATTFIDAKVLVLGPGDVCEINSAALPQDVGV